MGTSYHISYQLSDNADEAATCLYDRGCNRSMIACRPINLTHYLLFNQLGKDTLAIDADFVHVLDAHRLSAVHAFDPTVCPIETWVLVP